MDDLSVYLFLMERRGVERNVTNERQERRAIYLFFFFQWINSNDPSHTLFTQSLLLTQEGLIYRSQDTGAVCATDTSVLLI